MTPSPSITVILPSIGNADLPLFAESTVIIHFIIFKTRRKITSVCRALLPRAHINKQTPQHTKDQLGLKGYVYNKLMQRILKLISVH